MSALRKPNDYFTYTDYCSWDDDTRWELIDGVPYAMAAPSLRHQETLVKLGGVFASYLRGKKCRVFIAPCDVRLNWDSYDDTVLQPDLLVVCDPKKLVDGKAVRGAPDFVIEILSPSNSTKEISLKMRKYAEAGVGEVWIIPHNWDMVNVYQLANGRYSQTGWLGPGDVVKVGLFPDLEIDLNYIFGVEEAV